MWPWPLLCVSVAVAAEHATLPNAHHGVQQYACGPSTPNYCGPSMATYLREAPTANGSTATASSSGNNCRTATTTATATTATTIAVTAVTAAIAQVEWRCLIVYSGRSEKKKKNPTAAID
ncbi:hypothetical protein SYNPS1DRAFT_31202 [Syncephalis pseudoplumigaleata]|uniref:Uncharacterized protein n=1 Tax=Syncephalis pseudoplumigaleata TaxID=1712513 RepID=A0A4V1J0X7_9FUNG|nr:hypothetical protein SYNPS1DRAFT_31202 [Syncephalis pseudoplumigaleata]|eukprot:RKP23099.1 hypothetical protein SYNPS1DRAFT_31202 [Syncephalis pseudoplumigaleata]